MAFKAPRRPVILIVMDGVGHNPSKLNNAVAIAATPNLDRLFSSNPTTVIEASGRAVGLPDGQMGNSEVGHLTLGCGDVIRQDLVRINDAVADGSLATLPELAQLLDRLKSRGRPLHLVGLVSDGGIHSHLDHLIALIRICGSEGVRPLVHMITDGRDTAPQCATDFVDVLEPLLSAAGGAIASVCGRYYAMDRDRRWERVELAWRLLRRAEGDAHPSAAEGIRAAWSAGQNDEFIKPIVLPAFEALEDRDEVLFFNFRNDRPRELSEALSLSSFEGFDRHGTAPVSLTTLTRYDAEYPFPVLFEKEVPETTLGEYLAGHGLTQLRAAETEKYPHVTFFFSGGREVPFDGEDRILIDSPKVDTYDLKPEMSAYGILESVSEAVARQTYDFIVINFANGDMVGHTGVRDAVVTAVEVVDEVTGKLVQTAVDNGYSCIVTADHGNADLLIDPVTGNPHTQHTTFPVACCVIDPDNRTLSNGLGLPSVAPTVLALMGLPACEQMSARSLLL